MATSSSFGTSPAPRGGIVLTLPPLILHPFADAAGPGRLVESSRASLKLQGLLPAGEATREELDQALLEGRYSELRMLFYVGKDLARWIEQCLEFVERNQVRLPGGITYHSFASLLIHAAPPGVEGKLRKWGVADYKSIFTRALGLQFLFADVPARPCLSDDFVRHYFRYADQIFAAKQAEGEFTAVTSSQFNFELYSSGEYSRMLERAWGE
jgi:hypothetical protein